MNMNMNMNIGININMSPMQGMGGLGNMGGIGNMLGMGSMMPMMDCFSGSGEALEGFGGMGNISNMFGNMGMGMPDMGFGSMPGMQGMQGMQQGGMFGNQVNGNQMMNMMNMMMQMLQMQMMMLMMQMMQQMQQQMQNMGSNMGGGIGSDMGGVVGGGSPASAVGGANGANGSTPISGANTDVLEYAKKFLGTNAKDLKGVMPNFQDAGNGRKDCADFVSSVLQNTGKLQGHYNRVVDLEAALKKQGWVEVSQEQAQPGDVYLYTGENGNHTEIVAEPGAKKLIGSNNVNADHSQRVSYGNVAQSKKPRFYHKP